MQTQTSQGRITTAYAQARNCRDRRMSEQLQRAILHTGERLIRSTPQDNFFEESLDLASYIFTTGEPYDRLAHVARLAGLFLECDALGFTQMTHGERHTCRALVARHDSAEGRGSHVIDFDTRR